MKKKAKILLTNDDGYDSEGIKELYSALIESCEVVIVAPSEERSGISHAFTYKMPIAYRKTGAGTDPRGYIVEGTPSDCVKLAISHLLSGRPDLIVSGINPGENSGVSAIYSGTVAAAREGALWRIPAVAFSCKKFDSRIIRGYALKAPEIAGKILDIYRNDSRESLKGVFINVNFPECPPRECRGIKITRQSLAFFDDKYVKTEKNGDVRYWLTGVKEEPEESEMYDSRAIENGYITVSPLCYDATADHAIDHFVKLEER